MSTLEERVAFLEGRVEEHARGVDGIRDALVHLEERTDRRFEAVDARFTALEDKMDRRFEAFEQKVDARFTALESTLILRFDSMDTKIGRLTAIVVTAMAGVLAAVAGITMLR